MLILASSSPRRQEIIELLSIPYRVIPSHADERVDDFLTPSEMVKELSLRKAASVKKKLDHFSEGIIIGSDTVVAYEGNILGKPVDQDDAFRMLSLLQGKTHQVFSGIACIDIASERIVVNDRQTNVRLKALSEAQMMRYIASGEPMDKAGAYAIQGLGATIVDSIEGDYFNVVGMSISLLADMLAQFGIVVP